jgi:hypothetical protein
MLQRLTYPRGDPIANFALVLVQQVWLACEGELAVDLLKNTKIVVPPRLDGEHGEQVRNALKRNHGRLVRRVVRGHEVDSLAEVRDRPPPEPEMGHIGRHLVIGKDSLVRPGMPQACTSSVRGDSGVSAGWFPMRACSTRIQTPSSSHLLYGHVGIAQQKRQCG